MPCPAQEINRRRFVRTVSAGLALAPALGAEGWGEILAPRRTRVALVRTSDRKRGVTEVLKLLDVRGIDGKRVVLKPNFNTQTRRQVPRTTTPSPSWSRSSRTAVPAASRG